jgi:acyl-CoA dehydrogenase
MNENAEHLVAQTAERILRELADPRAPAQADGGPWRGKLWRALEGSGLTLAWVPEELGGAGASVAEGFEVISKSGEFALPIPLAETMLAGWLLSRAGIASPTEPMSISPCQPGDIITMDADGVLRGSARGIPFAREVKHIAVLGVAPTGVSIMLVNAKNCRLYAGENLAGGASDDVFFDGVRPIAAARAHDGFNQEALILMGCAVRALQIAGALQYILNRTVEYAGERIAFGRPIAKLQAVQANIARLAGEAAAARAVAESAADTLATCTEWDDGVFLEAAAAKIRCAEAAILAAALAHQVHGAIGITAEYVLHRFTLRVLGWCEDFGNESLWAAGLGHRIAGRGAESLWPLIASR